MSVSVDQSWIQDLKTTTEIRNLTTHTKTKSLKIESQDGSRSSHKITF